MAGLGHMHSKFCDVLPHVISQFDPATGISDICSLLQVSTAVRHTLQSCRADFKLAVLVTWGDDGLRRQVGVMRWLPHHAGLVSDLELRNLLDNHATADTLLELVLHACSQHATQALTSAAQTAVPAGSAAAGAQAASTLPLPLRLTKFSSNSPSMPPPRVLRLLQLAGLQRLNVTWNADIPISVYPALASMQDLTDLSLDTYRVACGPLPVAFAAALGQLQHLTCLKQCQISPASARLLPVSLKKLQLTGSCEDSAGTEAARNPAGEGDMLSFTHLTTLSSLLWTPGAVFPGAVFDIALPPQTPVHLKSYNILRVLGPFNLPDVYIERHSEEDSGLELLLQLPDHPHTRRLEVNIGFVDVLSLGTLQRMGTTLGALTNLTQLSLGADGPLQCLQHVHLLQHLRKLPLLVELTLWFDAQDEEYVRPDVGAMDMVQLSALTNLTRLDVLDLNDAGFDDVAASAVALNLTRLQELSLLSSSMLSWGILPAVARLTGLRSLVLDNCDGNPALTPALLQQLSTLTLLTELNLPKANLSHEEQRHFLAGLPNLCRTKMQALEWVF